MVTEAARIHRECVAMQNWSCNVLSCVADYAVSSVHLHNKLKTALEVMMKSINSHPDDEYLSASVKALVNAVL